MIDKLTDEEKVNALASLTNWSGVEGRDAIRQLFEFSSFNEAWGFMTKIALEAERINHHPEWSNTWSTVVITLYTHDCNGLSDRDIALAKFIDKLAP